MADVISHASTGGPSPSATARAFRAGAPALLVGIVCALAAEWTWWLHPHGVLQAAASPAAGFVLGALVLLPPRRWPAPAAVAALAVGLVAARHHAGVDIAVGRAVATVVAALAAALLLRGYATTGRDEFREALETGLAVALEMAADTSSESAPSYRRSLRSQSHCWSCRQRQRRHR